MNRTIRYPICLALLLLLAAGCVRENDPVLQPSQPESVTVLLTLDAEEPAVGRDGATRAVLPLEPDTENLIRDIWVIQYDAQGVIRTQYTRHYRETATPVRKLDSFPVELAVLNDCTVCLVVNRNPGQTGLASPWESTLIGFKRQYMDIDYRTAAGSAGLPDMAGIPMFGYSRGDITTATTSLNITVGRMLARVNLVVENATGAALSNVQVEVKNAVRRAYYYPRTENAVLTASDYVSFSDTSAAMAAGATTYLYYYVTPNLSPLPGAETTVTVSALRNGSAVSTLPVSLGNAADDPTIQRNNNYTISLLLK